MKKFFQKFKSKKGITLIELVIAVAIFAVVMGAVIAVYNVSLRQMGDTKSLDVANDNVKLQVVMDKYKTIPDTDKDGVVMVDGYKVEIIDLDKMGDLTLTDSAGNPVADLTLGKDVEKFYRITAPNGRVHYLTYE